MKDTFIEKAIEYPIEYGKVVIYESNTTCESISFKFDHHVITIMLAGQKSVLANGKRFEFFPGTLLMPQKSIIHNVKIPVASTSNPTKCLELDLDPTFVNRFYNELLNKQESSEYFYSRNHQEEVKEYISNDQKLIDTLTRIYERRRLGDSKKDQMIVSLMVKELLIDLFSTEALFLFTADFQVTKMSSPIRIAVDYINCNLDKKISMKELSQTAGIGLTSFFNKFKKEINISPAEYISKQRIELAKSYLDNGGYSLKDAAYSSGFNSYEHFCKTFKKYEDVSPNKYINTK